MSAEVFVYRDDNSARLTLDQLQSELDRIGVSCSIEQLPDGPWLVLNGCDTDMSITVDAVGTATSAMVQCNDPQDVLDRLFAAFEKLGWVVANDEE